MEIIYTSATFLSALYILRIYCYSNFNLLWILYVYFTQKKYLIPFITCNHIATIALWYSSWLMDNTIPYRMISKYNWSMYQFIFGDIVIHVLPTFYVLYQAFVNWNMIMSSSPTETSIIRYCGLYSLFVHLLWGLSLQPSFDVTQLYIELDFWLCNKLWFILILSHICMMNCFNTFLYLDR